jgi:tetratricopeptide (TPR) repeat protein
MRLSRCSTESGRDGMPTLSCTTCHDPHEGHRLSAAERGLDYGCGVCHESEDCTTPRAERGGRSCTSCHMAVVPSSDIAHTRTTDHFIRRRLPAVAGPARRPEETFIGALAAADRPLRNLLDPEGGLPGAELLRALAYQHGFSASASVLRRPAPGYAARLAEAAERLARSSPDDPDADLLRAVARHYAGDPAEAARILRAHEVRFGRRPGVRLSLAFALRELGRPADVAESARIALEEDPFEDAAARLLAEALEQLRRPAEAVDVLEGIRGRLGPSAGRAEQAMAAARAAGDAARAVAAGYDLLMFRSRDPVALSDVAHVVAFDAGDAAQARVLFEDALARDANCVPALVGLARVEHAAGNAAGARNLASRAERLQPGIPEVRAILASGGGR